MVIPYRAIHYLLSRFYVPKSLEGIIKDCHASFQESIDVATEIEDYEYLNQLITNRVTNELKYDFWWDYRHHLPTTLERDVDITIDALVQLAFDHNKTIHKQEFIDLIETVADNLKISPEKYTERFNLLYNSLRIAFQIEYEKIRRNQPCPCGSGKKYKKCHGEHV